MVGYNIQTDIIVGTMKSSSSRFTAEDIQCLQVKVAAEIIAQAKKWVQRHNQQWKNFQKRTLAQTISMMKKRDNQGGGEDLSKMEQEMILLR